MFLFEVVENLKLRLLKQRSYPKAKYIIYYA